MLNYVLVLLTVGLACVQTQMTSDSVPHGDLNGQETDVVFIYSLSCSVLMNLPLVNRRRQQDQVLSVSCPVVLLLW